MMNFTPQQERAAASFEQNTILSAGAGAGKTRVLTERIARLVAHLEEEGLGHQILAITFTRKATGEMKSRIEAALGPQPHRLRVQTIDGFCGSLLSIFAPELEINGKFRQMEEGESLRLQREVYGALLPEIFHELSHLTELFANLGEMEGQLLNLYGELRTLGALGKVPFSPPPPVEKVPGELLEKILNFPAKSNTNFAKYRNSPEFQAFLKDPQPRDPALLAVGELIRGLKSHTQERDELLELLGELEGSREEENRVLYGELTLFLERFHRAYGKKKAELAAMDFADLLEGALKLLEEPHTKKSVQELYQYIFIDEFQDTNPLQIRLLKSLLEGAVGFVVGDRNQSIYGFRGADDSAMDALKELNFEPMELTVNFRGHPQLMDFINGVFEGEWEDYLPVEGKGQGQCTVEAVAFDGEEPLLQEALWTGERVLEKDPGRTYGLLFRKKRHMEVYETAFRQMGIPFVNSVGQGFLEKRPIGDLILFLKYLAGDPVATYGFYLSPFVGLDDDGARQLFREGTLPPGREEAARRLRDYEELFSGQIHHPSCHQLVRDILYKTGYLNYVAEVYGREGLRLCYHFLSQVWEGEGSLLEFLEALEEEGDLPLPAPEPEGGVIQMMTIHGAKGLEFDTVFLGDLNGALPGDRARINYSPRQGFGFQSDIQYNFRKNREEMAARSQEEEKRIAYVAMTRARTELYFMKGPGREGTIPKLLEGHVDWQEAQGRPIQGSSGEGEIHFQRRRELPPREKPPVTSATALLREEGSPNFWREKSAGNPRLLGNLFHAYASHATATMRAQVLARARELSGEDLRYLEELMDRYDRIEGEVLGTEVAFSVELDGMILEGYFDQIRRKDGKLYLLDFKTGHAGARSPYMEQYRDQVGLYVRAFEKIHEKPIIGIVYTLADGVSTTIG
ncbi:MAG: UvrD-helicase domain-containing protein [Tissierellia bacterium]|nr:UvrD-helicase domain-containing protein [Tissierellia bacterium]